MPCFLVLLSQYVWFLTLAYSVVFFHFALFAEVRRRLFSCFLVDVEGVLCAVLAPVPFVSLASPNILNHSDHLF